VAKQPESRRWRKLAALALAAAMALVLFAVASFQRQGVINTARFDVPVKDLE